MQEDFHYYATYCAAYLAGYSHEESLKICYSAQFVDLCSVTVLTKLGAPKSAATTQLQLELMDARTDIVGLQDITRIWASFHFLPYDLYAMPRRRTTKRYLKKYQLICQPNGDLLVDTVQLAKDKPLQSVGIAMHVLADTWAHRNFAGTPSLVINNTNQYFYELTDEGERPIKFRNSVSAEDDLENGIFTCSLYQINENSIMNLGHGRAGHLPDYSFIRYKYLPAWGEYDEVIKDNPSEYYQAFCQMICAMQYLRGERETFEKDTYAYETVAPYETRVREILTRRQLNACADWKEFGEELSGKEIPDFDLEQYQDEYRNADTDAKDDTFLGEFILGALAQKSMVTNRIHRSDNILAGFSVDVKDGQFKGIRDYIRLMERTVADEQSGES